MIDPLTRQNSSNQNIMEMGVKVSKGSAYDIQRHREIEAQINEDRIKNQSLFRLLLLGPGESGKSTIVKQMRILHTNGFSDEEIRQHKTLISRNVLANMVAMIRAMKVLSIDFENPAREAEAAAILKAEENWQNLQKMTPEWTRITLLWADHGTQQALSEENLQTGLKISVHEWACIKLLWADGGIQKVYKRSNEYQLADSTKYFFDDIDRISMPSYIPTCEDILRTRVATLGIVEVSFSFRDIMLTIIDVGGQRTQRKKWIHCFDCVNCLIFVASLSEYDQVLFEDAAANRMQESLKLFGTVCNYQWFRNTPTILFLNKKDIFADKLSRSPLSLAFPSYKGENSYEPCVKFIEKEFHKRRENKAKDVYVHKTCATDTRNIEFVMGATFDIILAKNMKQAGLSWLDQL